MFADEKRAIPLLRQAGLTIASQGLLRNGYVGSISCEGKSVNLRGEKFSDVVSVETTAETAKRKFSASAEQDSEKRGNLNFYPRGMEPAGDVTLVTGSNGQQRFEA